MAMVTQCPHCTTAFHVTPEQLFARDGRVRCGNCREVFDGLVHLTSLEALEAGESSGATGASVEPPAALQSEPMPAPVTSPETTPAATFTAAPAPELTAAVAPAQTAAPITWPSLPAVPEVPLPPVAPLAQVAPATTALADAPSIATASALEAEPAAATADATSSEVQVPERRLWPWALAASVAALLLAGQAIYGFRSDIAARFPHLKAPLVKLCELARCSVPPLQKPSVLTIKASDLLIIDKTKPHLVQLIVTLENESNVEIGYPALDLTLNDRFDHAVARRVFLPKEYLSGADAQKTAIAASGTTTLRVNLDISELPADGFRVLLIPAPPT